MQTPALSPYLIVLLTGLLTSVPALADTPTADPGKLDKRLAPIADMVSRHGTDALQQNALLRQSQHLNSLQDARWNAQGQVQVYLHYSPGSLMPDTGVLTGLGATDLDPHPELGVIQAWVPATALDAVQRVPGVLKVSVPHYVFLRHAAGFRPTPRTGSVDTQGDALLRADSFRTATGITGQGVSVGVLSDGDDHISDSQKSGDLPANVWNDPKDTGGNGGFSAASSGDEGTAMMEIVYDLAPGVKRLGFCAPQTTADFLTCLKDLSGQIGARVIADDLGYPGSAMFTSDNFTSGLQSFAASHPSVQLVTAAGNDGTAYWQGTWNPMAVSTTVNHVTYTQAQNFGSTPYLQISGNAGDVMDYVVEWDDPWDDNSTKNDPNDYDVVVFDNPSANPGSNGSGAVACNQGITVGPAVTTKTPPAGARCDQSGSSSKTPGPTPVQGSSWRAGGGIYYLEVFYRAGTPGSNLKILVLDESSSQVTISPSTPGSIYGQAALPAPIELSTGAVDSLDSTLEPYSSTGPVQLGIPAGSDPSLTKPDFVAPDCVSITGAGNFHSPFCGTSAAAPHLAGIVALLMAGYPGQSPERLLKDSATALGVGTPNDEYGSGLPDMVTLLNQGHYPIAGAHISAPQDGQKVTTGQKVAFTGSCISYPKKERVTYDWDFGSGSGMADSSATAPSVSYKHPGSYTVKLSCTDTQGTGSDSIDLTVTAPAGGGGAPGLPALAVLLWLAARRRLTRR